MQDAPKLTARQQQILQLVQHAIARTGAPPTRAEIAAQLGFKSANAAEEHLQALARKGVIELVSGTSRGIRLKGAGRAGVRGDAFSLPLPGMASRGIASVVPVGRCAAGHASPRARVTQPSVSRGGGAGRSRNSCVKAGSVVFCAVIAVAPEISNRNAIMK